MGSNNDFDRLVKQAARALYRDLPIGSAGKTIDVLDALTSHQWVREKDLSKELKMGEKQLNPILKFLQEEKLIQREIPAKSSKRLKRTAAALLAAGEGEEKVKIHPESYCCLDYARVCDVVRYRIHTMIERLKSDMNIQNTVQQYICPNCERSYSALDALHLACATDEHFHCEICSENLVPVDRQSRCKESLDRLGKLKEELKPLSSSIEKVKCLAALEVISLERWRKAITDENVTVVTIAPISLVEATNVETSSTVVSSNQSSRDSGGMSNQLKSLQPLNRLKALPSWVIREGGVSLTEEQRKTINACVLDVEVKDDQKQDTCAKASCGALRKRQEEDPNVKMQKTRLKPTPEKSLSSELNIKRQVGMKRDVGV